ncbi:hypothetical protein Droror1_Dr00025651 [Drosera rotundifolia]
MGLLVGQPEIIIPKLLFFVLSILGYIRTTLLAFFQLIGLPDFLEPDINCQQYHIVSSSSSSLCSIQPDVSVSATLIREMLHVVKFSEMECERNDKSCAVCLYEFEGEEEIRQLPNCRHVFHRSCLDRWMDLDHKTCPLCRTHFVPVDLLEDFNHRLSAATSSDFDLEYCPITSFS